MSNVGVREKKVEKPKVLYRGSAYRTKDFYPKHNRSKPADHVDQYVYATSDMGYAWCFAFEDPQKDTYGRFLGRYTDRGTWRLGVNPGAFESMSSHTGFLYNMDPKDFVSGKKLGTPSVEWVSDKTVQPLNYTTGNPLKMAMKNGIQIYVLEPEVYKKIWNAKDHGASIIMDLDSRGMCVNQQLAPETYISLEDEANLAA